MSGYSTITLQEVKDVLVVPIEAIEVENDKKYVAVQGSDGTCENIEVATGIADSKYVQITSGLRIGEQVCYKDVATGNTAVTQSSDSNRSNSSSTMQMMRILQ